MPAGAEAQLRQILPFGEVRPPRDLRAEGELRQSAALVLRQRHQRIRQSVGGFGAPLKEMRDIFAVTVKVRREDHGVDALLGLHAEHGKRGVHVARAVVHPRQDVGVQIGHGEASPSCVPFFCSVLL